jgi:hypothetical protein
MNANPQTNPAQPNQQKDQPDVRGQNPATNKQPYGQPGKPSYDPQHKQQSSPRPQDEEDEGTGNACGTNKDSNAKTDPYKKVSA